MRTYRGLEGVTQAAFRDPAVTIGVFDGVHRGHQAVLQALREEAAREGGESVVITFDTHPRGVLTGAPPPLLTSLEHRLELFERAGIDATIVLHFDERLADVTAEAFVRDVIVGRIGARAVVLGADSHFGRGREGNVAFLEREKPRYGFRLRAVPLLPDEAAPGGAEHVSSTAIRRAISEGRLDDAARMLGRPPALLGRVVPGDGRGRSIGFPTANLEPLHDVRPPRGVYLALVPLACAVHRALVNVGVRPTFDGPPREVIEVHILGFSGDLYGRTLKVRFLRKLRDERRFPSVPALVAQIERDRADALAAEIPQSLTAAASRL